MAEKKTKGALALPAIKVAAIFVTELDARRTGGECDDVRFSTTCRLEGGQSSPDEHYATATVSVQPENCSEEQCRPYRVEVKITIVYRRESDAVTGAKMKEFAKANAQWHVWPYARELIADITARMGYPSFYLPFIPRPIDLAE